MGLPSKEERLSWKKTMGEELAAVEMKWRRTGRSTALAFEYISKAMLDPGSSIKVLDHCGAPESDKYLMRTIQEIIYRQDMKFFEFDPRALTFKFNYIV